MSQQQQPTRVGTLREADDTNERAPLSVAASKRAIMELGKAPADRDLDAVAKMVEARFASADYKEGRTAFMEKRIPDFRGA